MSEDQKKEPWLHIKMRLGSAHIELVNGHALAAGYAFACGLLLCAIVTATIPVIVISLIW